MLGAALPLKAVVNDGDVAHKGMNMRKWEGLVVAVSQGSSRPAHTRNEKTITSEGTDGFSWS